MQEHLLNFVGNAGHWGYLVIFCAVTVECAAVFFLAGETLVLIGGFFAAGGRLDLEDLIAVVALGRSSPLLCPESQPGNRRRT